MIDRVCTKIKGLEENKKGQQSFYELLPCRVGTTDEISKQLLDDIEVLANLEQYLNI